MLFEVYYLNEDLFLTVFIAPDVFKDNILKLASFNY